MHVRNHRDLWSGLMFLAIGLAFVIFSQAYQMGTPARMGPGFFPTMLGVLLTLLGAATVWQAMAPTNEALRIEPVGWRQLALVLVSILAFALALPRLGMVISVTLLIAVSASASHEFNAKETIVSIVVLLVSSWLVFIKGLELQFPVWPTFFAR